MAPQSSSESCLEIRVPQFMVGRVGSAFPLNML